MLAIINQGKTQTAFVRECQFFRTYTFSNQNICVFVRRDLAVLLSVTRLDVINVSNALAHLCRWKGLNGSARETRTSETSKIQMHDLW